MPGLFYFNRSAEKAIASRRSSVASFDSDQSMRINVGIDTLCKRNLAADKQYLELAQQQMSVPSKD